MTTTEYSDLELSTRNRSLQGALEVLQARNARKRDAVVTAQAIESRGGLLVVEGMGPVIEDGTADPPHDSATLIPGDIMLGHIADRLDVPVKYVRRMASERPDLFDANVNGLIHGHLLGRQEALARSAANMDVYDPDDHTWLVRSLTSDEGPGYGRALLSDRYASYDDLDMLLALLEGIKESGIEDPRFKFDLSERRMVVKCSAPELSVPATELLKGYRNPWGDSGHGTYSHKDLVQEGGHKVGDVIAGLLATNSETGGASWTVAPYIIVPICMNGLAHVKKGMRIIHLGGKLEAGEVRWSEDTEEKNIATIVAKTRDAVQSFLSVEFLQATVDEITEKATKRVENPTEMVELVANRMAYTEEQTKGILEHFLSAGQRTTGGIMQAVTSYAQEIENPDTAFEFETSALQALEVAYANA